MEKYGSKKYDQDQSIRILGNGKFNDFQAKALELNQRLK